VPIRTKRWNDPVEAGDGFRLLVCRLRPRGVAKAGQPWDEWWPDLGPSRGLLDDFHGKRGAPIPWETYVPRYLDEMRGAAQLWRIRDLARRLAEGATVTLLCSSACADPAHCHRTLLANLVTAAAARA
jgi:uncharacterized protein YeaO (DUF488 family)